MLRFGNTDSRHGVFIFKTILYAAVFGFLVSYVYGNWHAILEVGRPDLGWILLASVFALVSLLCTTWVYKTIFWAFGFNLSYGKVLGVQYVSRLGKYLPGKAWAVLWGVVLYDREGVSKTVAATSIALVSILGILGALFVIILFGVWSVPVPGGVLSLIFVAVMLLLSVHPRVFYPVLNYGLRLIGRAEIPANQIRFQLILSLLLAYIVIWVLYGAGFCCLVRSFSFLSAIDSLQLIAMFAFAQVAGLLVIVAPAGLGVRESALLLGLAPLVGEGPAIVLVGFCRLWQTVLEFLLAVVGWYLLRRGSTR